MKQRILLFIAVLLLPFFVKAQNDTDSKGIDVRAIFNSKQTFVPSAASLGTYGNIPVDYYTGRALVEIPLAELKGIDYDLPISVSYVTGGNKLNELPGIVGLGWSLNAGGCINRVVKGFKDEMSESELMFVLGTISKAERDILPMDVTDPGYLYHTRFSLDEDVYPVFTYPYHFDLEPDQFIFNFNGQSGSFYFFDDLCNKGGDAFVVSKTPVNYKIEYELTTVNDKISIDKINVYHFTYISKIIITDDKGIVYTFGGSDDAIDFSYIRENRIHYGDRLIGTANTWYLTSITFPGNDERISFTYEKHGFPICENDVHSRINVLSQDSINEMEPDTDLRDWDSDIWDWPRPSRYVERRYNSFTNENVKTNLSYSILHPSYLKSIRSEMTNDYIELYYRNINGLLPEIDKYEASRQLVLNNFDAVYDTENYYNTLVSISTQRGNTEFYYTVDSTSVEVGPLSTASGASFIGGTAYVEPINSVSNKTTVLPFGIKKERVHLAKIMIDKGSTSQKIFKMEYEKGWLPGYNSKMSDHWGYYNGKYYGNILSYANLGNGYLSDLYCMTTVNDQFNERRQPDEAYMKYEALKKIVYPTGGSTSFEYEANEYNKVVNNYPQRINVESGIAGGLRLKSIIDYDPVGGKRIKRSYIYNSSGILNGKPIYGIVGYLGIKNGKFLGSDDKIQDGTPWGWSENGLSVMSKLRMISEQSENQIVLTNHIGYSSVTEIWDDGSSIQYKYTDAEEYPDRDAISSVHSFSSRTLLDPITPYEFARGLIKETIYKNANDKIVKIVKYTYEDENPDSPINSGNFIPTISKSHIYPLGLRSGAVFVPNYIRFTRMSANCIYTKPLLLKEKETTVWGEDGNYPHSETVIYEYNSDLRLRYETNISNSTSRTKTFLWSGDITYGIYGEMRTKGMVGIPIEITESINNLLVSSTLQTWSKIGRHYLPSAEYTRHYSQIDNQYNWASRFTTYDGHIFDSSYSSTPDVRYTYNSGGRIIQQSFKDGSDCSIIWGYNDQYPVFTCSSAQSGDVSFYDFEGQNNTTGFHSNSAYVGNLSIPLPQTGLHDKYTVDYMVRRGNVWTYVKRNVSVSSGQNIIINEGQSPIDNVRVYPSGSMAVSYTWYPGVGVRSMTDSRGVTVSYVYDSTGRLIRKEDLFGNPITDYEYNYSKKAKLLKFSYAE